MKKTCALIFVLVCCIWSSVSAQNTSFFQAQFNGGVTACGYGPEYDLGGTGALTLQIPPGSTIYKAWLFAGRQGVASALTVTLNGSPYTFNNTNQVGTTFQSSFYGGNSGVHAIDVSSTVSSSVNAYSLIVPYQSGPASRFQDFYLYVAYTNPSLPKITSCIFLNSADCQQSINQTFNFTYPIQNIADVGMELFFGYACNLGDGETVQVNGTNLGTVYGPNSNSGFCAGPFGDFNYQSGTLTGISDGNPDQAINGPDAISNIKALVTNCTTSVSAAFSGGASSNALWGFLFNYTAVATPTNTDTTVCSGTPVQLSVPVAAGTVSWSPVTGLSCTTCSNPVATATTTTQYIATVTGGGCMPTVYDTATIHISGGAGGITVNDTSVCNGRPALLTAYPTVPGGTYAWTPGGATTQSITVNPGATSKYYVTYTSTCGTSKDSAIVTVGSASSSAFAQSICSGSTYTFHGQSLNTAGTYRDTLPNAKGCDSVITLTLTVKPVSSTPISQKICAGTAYTFYGQSLTAAGTYRDTLTGVAGCDSIIVLTLSVTPVSNTPVSRSICSGASYTFYGRNLTTAGTYRDTLSGVAGCDSIITLTLTVIPISITPVSQKICSGASYAFHGQSLTAAGIYRDTLTGVAGCDSIIVLTLSVTAVSTTPVSQSICSGLSYNFYGRLLSTTGTYRDTLTGVAGCDSFVVLTLTVLPVSHAAISQTICSGSTYNFDGQVLSTAGIYSDTLTNTVGCDSIIVLTLSVTPVSHTPVSQSICAGTSYSFYGQNLSSAGTYSDTLTGVAGCDSIITLTLTVIPVSTTPVSQTICSNASYNFYGQTLTSAGTYSDTLTGVAGCDSIIVLTLSVTPVSTTPISQSICAGSTYNFHGRILSTAGTYRDTLTGVAGCDSFIVLTLTVLPVSHTAISQTICNGSSYNFDGQVLSTAGTYSDTLINTVGCDSIIVLTLSVTPVSTTPLSQSICAGTSYSFYGQNLSSAGTYSDTLTGVAGCDSIIVLTLSVTPVSSTSISQSTCSNVAYNFNGQSLTAAGTYSDTVTGVAGCDSIIVLTLSVIPVSTTPMSQSICAGSSYTFDGQVLSTPGTYVQTLTGAAGCDSFVVLTLTVLPVSNTAISQTICSGSSYNFDGQVLSTAGTYSDTLINTVGCDSIIVLTLSVTPVSHTPISQSICSGASYTFHGLTITTPGIYSDTLSGTAGCDSIVTLALSVIPVSSTAISQTLCGGSYSFGTNVLSTSGIYIDTLSGALGCDSIVTLALTVLQTSTDTSQAAICNGQPYAFHGKLLTAAGTYSDTLTNTVGCDSIIVLQLVITPQPDASFVIDPSGIVSLGSVVTVTDQSAYADTIMWQLNNTTISLSPGGQLPVSDTGTYCLSEVATSVLGCRDTAMECYTIYNNSFYMPNAFTPNGDGVNDLIELYGYKESIKDVDITIFDRWGEKVFESKDINYAWDGTYRSSKLGPGIFIYILDVTFLSGPSIHNKGSITLIR